MRRTKASPPKVQALMGKLQHLGELLGRAELAARFGYQYGTDRDLYEALGWDRMLTYDKFYGKYERHDLAAAIVDRPVDATWRSGFDLVESSDDKKTKLEKEFKKLAKDLKLFNVFERLDRLSCIGQYGVLLLGLGDVQTDEQFKNEAKAGSQLLYLKPLGQSSAIIDEWDKAPNSSRFGLPSRYKLKVEQPGSNETHEIYAHHSRVLHVVGKQLESEVYGMPALQQVYNRLDDVEKIVGGSAEMFWRGARPGYQAILDENTKALTNDQLEGLQDQVDEFEHNLRRMFALKGVKFEALEQMFSDPSSALDVQLRMISAVTGIPKRVLEGSERGELSSAQDKGEWNELIKARMERRVEPNMIRPFVDRCIELKILPEPKEVEDGYTIEWEDLFAPSEKERTEVGKNRAEAYKSWQQAGEDAMPAEAAYEHFMALDNSQIELIGEMKDAAMSEEERLMNEIEKALAAERVKQQPPTAVPTPPQPGQQPIEEGVQA